MKRCAKVAIGVSALYVALYVALSVTGGYEPAKSGRFTRHGLNLPVHDLYLWQLRFGRDSPYHGRSQLVPWLFKPLLWVDRTLWHRPLPMLQEDDSGKIVECPLPPTDRMHPRMKAAQKIMADSSARLEEARSTPSSEDDVAVIEELSRKLEAIYE